MAENMEKPIIHTNGYDGKEPTRVCPHCGMEKPLSEFGWRKMGNGEIRNQSWCRKCRSEEWHKEGMDQIRCGKVVRVSMATLERMANE